LYQADCLAAVLQVVACSVFNVNAVVQVGSTLLYGVCFIAAQVVIDLAEPEPGNTVLSLTHTGLPEEDKYGHSDVQQQVEEGWKRQVFSNIKAIFGYGA
jgi:hypothetical protein